MYLSSEISYQDLALQEGITNPSLIVNWVNRFHAAGPDALRPRKKGRKKTLDKSDNTTQSKPLEETSVDTSAEHVRELEDELLKLRIENAFLKELRRLRLEDEAKNERTARIISSLRRRFKLKALLSYTRMPKATYMYWQKRFDRENPDKEVEEKILEIRKDHKDYGYPEFWLNYVTKDML